MIFRCACQHLSWSTSSPASVFSSCPPQSRRVVVWERSPWLSGGSSCWPMADLDTWRWRSTEIWRSDTVLRAFKKKTFPVGNCSKSLFWHCGVIIHPLLLYRRWRCRQLPSCSCESPVWSCEFTAERTLSKLIWRLRLICGTWWSKRCGPAAAWPTSTRWCCCNQTVMV